MASKLAEKFQKIQKMKILGGSRGPLKFRSFFLLIFEVYGVPFGCQLGCNLAPKMAPRRARGRKKGIKKTVKKIEVYVGSRPELEDDTQKDAPDVNFGRFSGPSWQDFQGFFKGFFRLCERSERASAASEASGATSRQTQHEAAGSLEQITRFPFLIKTGLC